MDYIQGLLIAEDDLDEDESNDCHDFTPSTSPNSERQSEDTNQSETTGINNGFVEVKKTQ